MSLRARPAALRACAAVAAAALATAGCGGGERRDADAPDGDFPVAIERASFPAQQHLGQRSSFVLTVRNAGPSTIPNVVVTLRGFRDGGEDVWIVDSPPAGTATAAADTWAAGPLPPDNSVTLRWSVTPVVAGGHDVTYAVAPVVAGEARAVLAGGKPAAGAITVDVDDDPPDARVDPRTGAVQREE